MMRQARRSRRVVLFDALESRELLSAVAAPSAEVEALKSKAMTYTGTTTGTYQTMAGPAPESEQFTLMGSGSFKTFGTGTINATFQEQTVHGAISSISGTSTLTLSEGKIDYSYTGKASGATKQKVTLSGSITGGTGEFAGIAGTFTGKGTLTPTSTSTGTFKLTSTEKVTSV